jgi:hypothetical protein
MCGEEPWLTGKNLRNLVDRHCRNNSRIVNMNARDPMLKHEPAPR